MQLRDSKVTLCTLDIIGYVKSGFTCTIRRRQGLCFVDSSRQCDHLANAWCGVQVDTGHCHLATVGFCPVVPGTPEIGWHFSFKSDGHHLTFHYTVDATDLYLVGS